MAGNDHLQLRVIERYAREIQYLGLILDTASQRRLLTWWDRTVGVPLHDTTVAHHVTIQFKPSPEQIAQAPLGQRRYVKVVGWAADEKAQAVVVSGVDVAVGRVPHVTVALDTGVAAAYSNTLLQHGYERVAGPSLTGAIEVV